MPKKKKTQPKNCRNRVKIDIPISHRHVRSLDWRVKSTLIKSGGAKLVLWLFRFFKTFSEADEISLAYDNL